jgi:hypothetical protein
LNGNVSELEDLSSDEDIDDNEDVVSYGDDVREILEVMIMMILEMKMYHRQNLIRSSFDGGRNTFQYLMKHLVPK